jgi:hypothetical protein
MSGHLDPDKDNGQSHSGEGQRVPGPVRPPPISDRLVEDQEHHVEADTTPQNYGAAVRTVSAPAVGASICLHYTVYEVFCQ